MNILGVDPGLLVTGYGVIELVKNQFRLVTCGMIRTKSKDPLAYRLERIHAEIRTVLEEYQPDQAAIEDVFYCKNVNSAIKLGQARAAVLLACGQKAVPVAEYSATRIKQAVTGNGHADKAQVQRMVKALLGQKCDFAALDVSDALAIALCHSNSV